MSIKDTSEPAFPSENGQYFGMSLRDYFAAKALPAILQSDLMIGASRAAKARGISPEQAVAIAAYEMADAMLQERAR